MKTTKQMPKGIRIHKSGGFIADVCINKQRYTRVCKTLEEAIIARSEMTKAHEDGSHETNINGNDEWTLNYAVKKTFQLVWEGRNSEVTNGLNSKAVINYFGGTTKVRMITLDKIDAYVEHLLDSGNSGSTVNRKLSCLSRILRTAYDRGKLKVLPKMPRRREGTHRVRFLSTVEEERVLNLLEHLGYTAHREAITMLIYTGFRCSELWRLERRDVDLKHFTLTAWKTKNSHPRTIPIVETLLPIIEKRLAATRTDTERLFPEGSNAWLRQVWDKVRLHLGMDNDPQFVPHMLRHTCATRLSQRGASMAVIKEWMGHSDIATTSRYTHFAPQDLRQAAQLLAG